MRYAADHGVPMALENSRHQVDVLKRALDENETLGFCWDVGHGVRSNPPLDHTVYLEGVFKERLSHVHAHDHLPPEVKGDLPGGISHRMVGLGGTSQAVWVDLGNELKARHYEGLIVLELLPLSMIYIVARSRANLQDIWGELGERGALQERPRSGA